jgi:hypothetical protein
MLLIRDRNECGQIKVWRRATLIDVDYGSSNLFWGELAQEQIPFDQVRPGIRYRVVIADC